MFIRHSRVFFRLDRELDVREPVPRLNTDYVYDWPMGRGQHYFRARNGELFDDSMCFASTLPRIRPRLRNVEVIPFVALGFNSSLSRSPCELLSSALVRRERRIAYSIAA